MEQAIEEIKKKKQFDKDAGALIASLEEGLMKAVAPAIEKAVEKMAKSIGGLQVNVPEIKMPDLELDMAPVAEAMRNAVSDSMRGLKVNIPEIKAPTVNVPTPQVRVDVPPMTISEVALKGVDSKNPVPVMMMGTDGKPLMFPSVGGGSKANFLAIRNMLTANGDSMIDETNDALRVNMVASTGSGFSVTPGSGSGGSGESDENTFRVVHATDVALSVNISSFTSSVAVVMTTDDGDSAMDEANDALRVNVVAGSLSANTQYNDGATPDQAGGIGIISALFDGGSVQTALGSSYGIQQVQLSGFDGSLVGITSNALDVNIASSSPVLAVRQVSGVADSVSVLDFNGNAPATGLNETTNGFLRVVQPTDFTGSVNVTTFNGNAPATGLNEVTSGFLRVVNPSSIESSVNVMSLGGNAINLGSGTVGTGTLRTVMGTDSTVMVVGDTASDVADSALAPVKIGGIARQANPTAVAAGDRVSATYDDLGRQVMRINQVRDLIQTAYATLSNGTETTLLAGAASTFHDLIYIMGANDSGAAVQVDIRAATAANKVMTLEIPANGTAGVSLPVPIPQDVAADTWTADMPDITGTNVYISALFSKEV